MKEILTTLIDEETLNAKVEELAGQISRDYGGKEVVLLGILKGAWMFMADLIRKLDIPVMIDFVGISSYGTSTKSSGIVRITSDLSLNVQGKHVLIVEDITDTGMTTQYLLSNLKTRKPASLKICTLLDKTERREAEIPLDYVGFNIPNRFVVGYGLDYAERYRQLPYVAEVTFSEED
jgi:hypoxanthine phosphoribosyltransferase